MVNNETARTAAIELMQRADGWLFQDEARLLFDEVAAAAIRDPEGRIVEIGSFKGRSTIVLGLAAILAQKAPRVYAIDPHEGNLPRGPQIPPTWETFIRNIREAGLDGIVIPVRQKAADVQWPFRISVLFIDGLHDYASVSADYRKFAPFVPYGGTIAFHDYSNPDFPDVARFVDERLASGELAVVALPEKPGPESSLIVTRRNVALSIIVPTIGRPSLSRTLESIVVEGATLADEVVVVGDGDQPEARRIVDGFRGRLSIKYLDGVPETYGFNVNRNTAMRLASGTHLWFLDDDDVAVDGAIRYIRCAIIEQSHDRVLLFRERSKTPRHPWDVVWGDKRIYCGNVGTQMTVVPNVRNRLGIWGGWRTGDYDFIRSTVDLYPRKDDDVVWIDRVVAELY